MADTGRTRISGHDKAILDQIFNPLLPYGDIVEEAEETEESNASDQETNEIKAAKQLEINGVKAAEKGDVNSALDFFNQAVSAAPDWPSAYNNRAQGLRLRGDIKGALQDLNLAIEKSNDTGKVACQAYTQRGLIQRLEGDDEGAKEDFKKAAHLGSDFAKQQLVAMNPYAAMCNQMLTEVIEKIKKGET